LAATYFWFPKMFGRSMNERLGTWHFWITLFGAYAIFMPMHLLGAAGHPRRYSELTGVQYVAATAPLQKFITLAAVATIAGQVIFLMNFFRSLWKGPQVDANPWECTTLEWRVFSASRRHGPDDALVINHGPYEYRKPGAEPDFIMQDDPAT